MSRISKSAKGHPLGAFVQSLKENYDGGDLHAIGHRTELAGMVGSLESLTDEQFTTTNEACSEVVKGIVASMESAGLGTASSDGSNLVANGAEAEDVLALESFQLEAGSMIGASFGKLADYGTALRGPRNVASDAVTITPAFHGGAGRADFGASLHASLESFDDQMIDKYREFSVAFNVLASRQDAFGEALFPTQIASADQAGLEGRIHRAVVFRPATRNTTGAAMDLQERNLIEGYADDTVLASTATKIYPMITAGAEGNFVSDTLVANQTVVVEGQSITTNFLAVNQEFDLIGLGQTDAVIRNGAADHMDMLDRAPAIERVVVSLTLAESGGAVTVPVAFDVRHLGRAEFIPQREGDIENELALNFPLVGLRLTSATTQIDTSALPSEFQALLDAGVELTLTTTLTGTANLRTGLVHVSPSALKVHKAWDPATNTELSLVSGAGADAAAHITDLSVAGFKVEAYRSNLNLRTEGHLVDTREYAELYPAQLGAPFTSQKAISNSAAQNGALLEVMTNAARVRTSNNAVIVLQNFASLMKGLVGAGNTVPAGSVQDFGLGRFLITPYYNEKDLDVAAKMNSTRAHERAQDVQGVIVNQIRSLAYQMYRDCGYGVALDSMTGGAGSIPRLVIATDEELERHVQINGDLRVAGPKMDYDIVSSSNNKVKGKIYLTFVRKGVTGVDPLSFGFHVWQPELVTRAQVTRGASHAAETIVQPRSTQYISMPVLSVINVTGLEEALEDKTPAA